ncbi:MAG: PLP-dependent aspartate aminotransferase family protein [Alicyclobacillaceae bacterium]|nr:PLP-dependent aspartate aminotransferase family protein [Alicyclobacillaceae bacterium]
MKKETRFVHIGSSEDRVTGAVSPPIYPATTYRHPGPGQSTGYDYTRTGNPTRDILENTIAELEEGDRGFALASGMAAITLVFSLFGPGDRILVSDDLYGGTWRLLERVLGRFGLRAEYVDLTRDDQWLPRLPGAAAVFVETPSNPLMKIVDIERISRLAKRHGALVIVDNTFMTPFWQRPLTLGADVVVHSATKYLGGHNDVLAGLIVSKGRELSDRLTLLHHSVGAILSPHDCWLLLRGMKTLPLRLRRHEENAAAVARWLSGHPRVREVYYPGLESHPGYELHWRQASGAGGMVSFRVWNLEDVERLLSETRVILFAESLGGLETLITHPARQTHADIDPAVRERMGITEDLLRLSVGVEDVSDLLDDLAGVLGPR